MQLKKNESLRAELLLILFFMSTVTFKQIHNKLVKKNAILKLEKQRSLNKYENYLKRTNKSILNLVKKQIKVNIIPFKLIIYVIVVLLTLLSTRLPSLLHSCVDTDLADVLHQMVFLTQPSRLWGSRDGESGI